MPNRDQRRRDGTFEYAQLDIAPASDEPALIACTCTPCVTPGNGGPTPGHCAACCGLTGIEEYDPACPVVDHREMALRQFGAASDEPARCRACCGAKSDHIGGEGSGPGCIGYLPDRPAASGTPDDGR